METTTSYWGNALGLRIPRALQEISNITDKTRVRIEAEPDKLIITKIKEPKKHTTLAERLKMYPVIDFIQEDEIDWGKPVGDEIW